jgi:hypothetical protein
MGLRNATSIGLMVPDLTTTVLTLPLTGLAAHSSLAGGNNPRPLRRLVSVIAPVGGAAVGAVLIRQRACGAALRVRCMLATTAAYVSIARSTEDR